MNPARILCWFRHDWAFTLNFQQEPDADDQRGSSHWSGECQRCGKRDLFRGPYQAIGEHP